MDEKLRSALQYWKTFGLDGRKTEIDSQALKMCENDEKSQKARESLRTITKQFKEATGKQTFVSFGMGKPLQAYQKEIDDLTRRANFAENAFLVLYKALNDAPDPTPLLEVALSMFTSQVEVQAELLACKEKIADYEKEFSLLKNQDFTIRKLETENKLLQLSLETRAAELIQETKKESEQKEIKMIKHQQETEKELNQRINELTEELSKLHVQYEQNQTELFSLRNLMEKAQVTLESDRVELIENYDQQKLFIETLRSENNRLKQELNHTNSELSKWKQKGAMEEESGSEGPRRTRLHLQAEIEELKVEISRLEEKRRLESVHTLEKEEHQQKLTQTIQSQSQEIQSLKQQLQQLPTMEEYLSIKQQIQLLQEIDFDIIGTDFESKTSNPTERGAALGRGLGAATSRSMGSSREKSLIGIEQLLAKRNREIQAHLTKLKLENTEKTQALEKKTKELQQKDQTLEDQKQLIIKLEEDLAQAVQKIQQKEKEISGGTPIRSLSATRKFPEISAPERTESFDFQLSPPATLGSNVGPSGHPSGVAGTVDQSLVSILVGQRDRLRQKCEELEKEKIELQQILKREITKIEEVKAENLKLYEKLQYVIGYSQNQKEKAQSVVPSTVGLSRKRVDDVDSVDTDDSVAISVTEKKYGQLYEETVNPFKEFRQKQRDERYKKLSPSEKITLNVVRFFFSKKATRTFLFFYALILHILVGYTLWAHTIRPHCHPNAGPLL